MMIMRKGKRLLKITGRWQRGLLALLAVMIFMLAGCATEQTQKTEKEDKNTEEQPDTFAITQAVYPDRSDDPQEDTDALLPFVKTSAQTFLADTGTENVLYSPLNLYLALGMLSEVTDTDSRAQILDVLQSSSVDETRKTAKALWESNYRDDGIVTCTMANSIWLNDQIHYKKELFQTLAENYYASAFSGQMGSNELNQAFAAWLNEQTGGLLTDEASQMELSPYTVIALVSTVYYQASWKDKMDESQTAKETFHAPNGDVMCDMMKETYAGTVYSGEHFTAAQKRFTEGGNMIFILPDEDSSVDEVLGGDSLYEFLAAD
jgi:serpin B